MANTVSGQPAKADGKITGKCPVCGKQSLEKHRPFCSAHCGYVDLNRWFGGNYAIPAVDDEPADEIETDQTGG